MTPRTVTPPPATNTHVQVALTAIAAGLPESISHKVPANPEQFVPIPVDSILPQLANGQVVMTAAELRECAPDYFSALAGHDTVEVSLPLGDIVKQLSAEHFERRNQTRVEVPAEVTPVFAGGMAPSTGKATAATIARPALPQPAPMQRAQPTIATTTTPAYAPAPAPTPAPAPKITMSPQSLAALNGKASTPVAVPTRPAVVAKPTTPPVNTALGMGRGPVTVQKKAAPAKVTGSLKVPLSAVWADWIDEVRAQLTDVDVAQLQIHVPLELLEPAMKAGRVLFSWQEVASWIQPPLAIPPTPKVGEMPVELSLKAVAPLFMANHRGAAQKRVTISDSIPDLFAGGDGSALVQTQVATAPESPAPVAAPVAPVQPVPASKPHAVPTPVASSPGATLRVAAPVQFAPEPAAAPAPEESTASPDEDSISLEQIIGTATGRLGAKEIVANAARIPGAAGALLAMSDGLLVTSQAPASCKTETIAAFLPQMFGRMNQYTKELTLGPLDRLGLSVASGEWQIFKAPNIYFAVLGKRGEALPLNLLAQVAAELSSQSQ